MSAILRKLECFFFLSAVPTVDRILVNSERPNMMVRHGFSQFTLTL